VRATTGNGPRLSTPETVVETALQRHRRCTRDPGKSVYLPLIIACGSELNAAPGSRSTFCRIARAACSSRNCQSALRCHARSKISPIPGCSDILGDESVYSVLNYFGVAPTSVTMQMRPQNIASTTTSGSPSALDGRINAGFSRQMSRGALYPPKLTLRTFQLRRMRFKISVVCPLP
jgi:hypothetical protein